jgi:DNA replication protein DnaC
MELPMKSIGEALLELSRSTPTRSQQSTSSTSWIAELPGDPNCPYCRGIGYLRTDLPVGHPNFGKLDPCVCHKSKRAPRTMQISEVTPGGQHLRLADIQVRALPGTAQTRAVLEEFIKDPTYMVTIWGPPGNGKTMALRATANELIAGGVQAEYVTLFDLIRDIKKAFHRGQDVVDEDAYDRLVHYERVVVLVVDELDKVHVTDWVQELLTGLIDKRYRLAENGTGGTLIAMNGDPAQLEPWLASRLADGRNVIVHNDDPDLRPALER